MSHGGVRPEHLGQLLARQPFPRGTGRAGWRAPAAARRSREPAPRRRRRPARLPVRPRRPRRPRSPRRRVAWSCACARAAPSASATSSVSPRTAPRVTTQAKHTSSSVSSRPSPPPSRRAAPGPRRRPRRSSASPPRSRTPTGTRSRPPATPRRVTAAAAASVGVRSPSSSTCRPSLPTHAASAASWPGQRRLAGLRGELGERRQPDRRQRVGQLERLLVMSMSSCRSHRRRRHSAGTVVGHGPSLTARRPGGDPVRPSAGGRFRAAARAARRASFATRRSGW